MTILVVIVVACAFLMLACIADDVRRIRKKL